MPRLLVVDPDESMQALYVAGMRQYNIDTVVAKVAEEALAAFDTHNDIIAVVVCAFLYQGALQPIDLVPLLAQKCKGPIITATGGGTIEEQKFLVAGCTHAAPKPDTLRLVTSILETRGLLIRQSP